MSKLVHTHIAQSFSAEIVVIEGSVNKKLKLIAAPYYQNFLNMKCRVGDKVTVTITNKKPKRTQAQNNYYFGVYIPEIMRETGENDSGALHELFKRECLPNRIANVLGQSVAIQASTTELSVSEFSEFIMAIEELTGVMAPPTENFELAPLKITPKK